MPTALAADESRQVIAVLLDDYTVVQQLIVTDGLEIVLSLPFSSPTATALWDTAAGKCKLHLAVWRDEVYHRYLLHNVSVLTPTGTGEVATLTATFRDAPNDYDQRVRDILSVAPIHVHSGGGAAAWQGSGIFVRGGGGGGGGGAGAFPAGGGAR